MMFCCDLKKQQRFDSILYLLDVKRNSLAAMFFVGRIGTFLSPPVAAACV